MADYKQTLNLPKTAFPMKANLAQREPNMLKHWQSMNMYQRLRELCQGRETFIYHDGPPYANARPHMGTALNKTLKDIICKAKLLSGYDAAFIPGWDCHGLPIELNVEKKLGKVGVKVDAKTFRQACRDYALKQVELQKTDFERMGVFADWANPYLTMDYQYEADTVRGLAAMIEKGHLQKGEKPVHWCPLCASALAEAEVEYKDKVSPQIDVAFAAIDPAKFYQAFNTAVQDLPVIVPIWTTTPWTLPANQAVALNKEVDYVLVQTKHGCFVLAEALSHAALARYEIDDAQVLATVKGAALDRLVLQHPFLERQVPVILAGHVTTDAGTGAVHTAPAHGQDDFVVGKAYGLPVDNPVNSSSCYKEDVPFFAGLHVYKANEPVIEKLQQTGALLARFDIEHSYPHCWRHKTPLIFRATPQWFISMDKQGLRDQALAEITKTQWYPSWGENRISKMVQGRPDWCISRQRTWGTPIALFVHKDTGELHPNAIELMHQAADKIAQGGVQAWYDLDPAELLGEDAPCYDKVTDTLDVWFDSGVSHYCVLNQREGIKQQADLYLEGSDQHRGWFQSSLMTGIALDERAPYKTVVTHGFIVDGNGHKMSKSLGNTVLPHDVINKVGADVMRMWISSTDYQNDIRFSDEILNRAADAYRRVRNTARFLLSNLNDFDPASDCVAANEMVALDRFAVALAQDLQQRIMAAYENYELHSVYQLIHNFCAVELGSFYLDVIKDRQYTVKAEAVARRSSQTAMYHILQGVVRWLAPIASFTAEEIWQHMPGDQAESVFFTTWYQGWKGIEADNGFWQQMMRVRDEVNKLMEAKRAAGLIGSNLEANVRLYAKGDLFKQLQSLEDELRFVLITSEASVEPWQDIDAGDTTDIDDLAVYIAAAEGEKCQRCWQRRPDVGLDKEHSGICGRCVKNCVGSGETRQFA